MSTKRQPGKRPSSKASGNRTTTTTGTLLGSLITINFGGGRSKRRGGGLAGFINSLLKTFLNGGGGAAGGGAKPDRPGRGDVDEHLDSGGLGQAPDTSGGFISPGRGPGSERGSGQGAAGQRTHGPRRAR